MVEYAALACETPGSDSGEIIDGYTSRLADLEWVAGYFAGCGDAEHIMRGEPVAGPGVTEDGWSVNRVRQLAYAQGLEDG
jgi:hypothetical protein